MKKILFMVQLPPPVHGASVMNKHVVDLFQSQPFKTRTLELRFVKDVSSIGSVSLFKILKMLTLALRLIAVLISFRPDIVYFTLSPIGGAFYRDSLYVAILKLFGIKIVYHLHGKGIIDNLNVKWKKSLYKFVFKNTNVIHLSRLLEKDIEGLGYSKIFFVANGINTAETNEEHRKNERIQFLFLSNLTISKGLFVLLDSCAILKAKGHIFDLNIVGNEFDITFTELKKKVDNLGLSEFVHVLGAKYGNDKDAVLKSADVFVLPTAYRNECFPLVLLEGMQFSLPLISTYEGAIPEIIDDGTTGFIVHQNNPNELAERMEILLKDDNLRRQMGKNGRTKFEEKYTINSFKENIVAVMKEIADE